VNVEQIANQQQRKGKSMLKDKEQVLRLWCVVQTNYVDQKRFAKSGLDLDLKTWEDRKIDIIVQKADAKDKKEKD
jgi:glycerol-3-phosphate cytidylyltransferase-like family protein